MIQSTVADTCMIAMYLLDQYRIQRGLKFRLTNQIHDALILEVKEEDIDAAKLAFKETMGNIPIPMLGREPLILGVDITVMTRWGEKQED